MTIALEKVRPLFLDDDSLERSEIWGEELDWPRRAKIRIVAPSGKGKTLLTQILYGLRQDYGGSVRFFGEKTRSVGQGGLCAMRRERLAIVFQEMRLFAHLTGLDNIDIKASLTGPLDRDRVEDQARRLGIAEALRRPCAILSQGEQQRVAIVRALAQPFDWLLLDEPFSHLDGKTARAAGSLIEDVCAEREAGLVLTSLGGDDPLSVDREYVL